MNGTVIPNEDANENYRDEELKTPKTQTQNSILNEFPIHSSLTIALYLIFWIENAQPMCRLTSCAKPTPQKGFWTRFHAVFLYKEDPANTRIK